MTVEIQLRGDCAVLTFGQGAQNVLLPDLRADIMAAFKACAARPGIRAIVLRGAGGVFSTGLDLDEMESPRAEPGLALLCQAVEDSRLPVVALLEGTVAGGGLSLALAAHGRVAVPSARLVFPELRLAQMPAGGATQRLPRLVGAQTTLRMMLGARPVPVSDPALARLVRVAEEVDPETAACAMALDQRSPRRARDSRAGLSDPNAYLNAIDAAAKSIGDPESAASGVAQAVEAALLLPFEQGLALEAVLSETCRGAFAARAARHALRCKRVVAQEMGVDGAGRAVGNRRLRLTGGGAEAAELAVLGLDAGWAVELATRRDEAILARVANIYNRAVQRGRLDSADAQKRLSRLWRPGTGAPSPGLTLHLDPEEPAETLALTGLVGAGPATRHPRLWFRPPLLGHGLAELHIPNAAPQDTAAAILDLLHSAGRQVVRVPAETGAASRLLDTGAQAVALALLARGVDPGRIDRAAHALGLGPGPDAGTGPGTGGPCGRMDRMGHDVARRAQETFASLTGWRAETRAFTVMAEAGRDRFLTEDAGLGAVPSDLLRRMAGADAPALTESEIGRACHAGLVNVVMRGLARGILPSAASAEILATHVLGLEAARRGLLFQADETGLLTLSDTLRKLAAPDGSVLAPLAVWGEMIRDGRGFFQRAGTGHEASI